MIGHSVDGGGVSSVSMQGVFTQGEVRIEEKERKRWVHALFGFVLYNAVHYKGKQKMCKETTSYAFIYFFNPCFSIKSFKNRPFFPLNC